MVYYKKYWLSNTCNKQETELTLNYSVFVIGGLRNLGLFLFIGLLGGLG